MMKCLPLIIAVIALAGLQLTGQISLNASAEEIISKELAVTNEVQFADKLTSFITQMRALLLAPFNDATKVQADRLYIRLSALLEVYSDHYKVAQDVREQAESLLRDLSSKFRLMSPADLISIEDVTSPIQIGTSSIADLFSFALSHAVPPFTQTEAYLSRSRLRMAVEQSGTVTKLGSGSGIYNNLLAQAILEERAHRNHYVFYHAQSAGFILFYDVLKEVLTQLHKKEVLENFQNVRIPSESLYSQTVSDLLQKEIYSDHDEELRKILMSVNFSLFGNSKDPGESTFDYFASNHSNASVNHLKLIFNEFNLNTKYIPKFKKLFQKVAPKEGGNLLQIFIPKDTVDSYVYLSQAYGRLLKQEPHWDAALPLKSIVIKDKEGKHVYAPENLDVQTYLKLYCTFPKALNIFDMDGIQGRIVITNDFLQNRDKRIKIYRYNTMEPSALPDYKKNVAALVKDALEERSKAEIADKSMSTLEARLFKAVYDNDLAAVIKAIEDGANMKAKNYRGQTVFDRAKHRNSELLKLLKSHKLIKLVLGHKIDVNHREPDGMTELSTAVYDGNVLLVDFLLQHGADSNIRDNYGSTPLIKAIAQRSEVMVKMLIGHGADVNFLDEDGESPLDVAVEAEQESLVKLLLAHKARLSVLPADSLRWLNKTGKHDRTVRRQLIDQKARAQNNYERLMREHRYQLKPTR